MWGILAAVIGGAFGGFSGAIIGLTLGISMSMIMDSVKNAMTDAAYNKIAGVVTSVLVAIVTGLLVASIGCPVLGIAAGVVTLGLGITFSITEAEVDAKQMEKAKNTVKDVQEDWRNRNKWMIENDPVFKDFRENEAIVNDLLNNPDIIAAIEPEPKKAYDPTTGVTDKAKKALEDIKKKKIRYSKICTRSGYSSKQGIFSCFGRSKVRYKRRSAVSYNRSGDANRVGKQRRRKQRNE